ncbi:MAG: glycerophosphodiester phosphodiesterase [Clostridia bacterium]|nr:glycerophosphodiester phosphodiesterase [Clostridia bacterium]
MIALYISLSVVAVFLALFLFLVFPSLRKHPDCVVLNNLYIAHRGLHGLSEDTPENSLRAFEKAVEWGYGIEIDIHLTKDGKVVVFHDDTLNRVCGVDGRVEDKTLAELKQLRLLGTDCEIPTLQECLDTVNGKVPLLIEFKCISLKCNELCRAADEILSKYNGKYLIQSFYPTVLGWYKKHRKDICRGQLASAFKGEEFYKRLLGCLLFNVVARPHFVSYEHKYRKNIFRRLVTSLGAFPVGWTFQSQKAVDDDKVGFKAYIFEGFIPEK